MNRHNNDYLDPIAAIEQPRRDFIRYLLTAYPLRDPHLRYDLKQKLEQPGAIWQNPYLEGSQPYRAAKSIQELIDSGVLHSGLADLFLPPQRPLFQHQEQAIEALVTTKENVVVATGTGSGKTECFLIPILDQLLKEGAESLRSKPGVRILILYPMNALINDQVKRLRQLLCRQKQALIRFGFYTSRTEEKPLEARKMLKEELEASGREELEKLFSQSELSSLDLSTTERLTQEAIQKISRIQAISREEFWQNPPHILLTNYSMLEHMLIRPLERSRIFEASSQSFKWLVVDEAHTYNGSTGTEVSMLLKRLKTAVGKENEGEVRCIATSASLGDASVDNTVLQFAQDLFGEKFNEVIRGDRVSAKERLGEPYSFDHKLSDQPLWDYLQGLTLPSLNAPIEEWSRQLKAFVPAEKLQAAQKQVSDIQPQSDKVHKFLWFALKQHPLIHRLINILSQNPAPWYDIASSEELWGCQILKTPEAKTESLGYKLEKALAYLVQLGTLARENSADLPLLPVRLHLLFRSLEGVYACINPACTGATLNPEYPDLSPQYGRLYLNEKNTCESCESPVLELGSCSQCGQAYVFTLGNV